MLNYIKNLFKKSKHCHHLRAVSEKDKSGRIRYKIYVDGKLSKKEFTWTNWVDDKRFD